jgi:hypothetical protein
MFDPFGDFETRGYCANGFQTVSHLNVLRVDAWRS